MYPWFRLARSLASGRKLPPIGIFETHVSQHRVSLMDIDMFMEMNNGRILTIFEFGRWDLSQRTGLWDSLRKKGWGFTVAGSSVRYRKRLLPLERFEMRTRLLGWDDRFIYVEQAMFKKSGECANHVLFRTAVVSDGRAVPPPEVAELLGQKTSPPLPGWVQAWVEADKQRPWPPMEEATAVSLAA
ncbi:MAG: acyl-CoA thioesterase [Pseudomonadota bacterium]